MKLLVVVKPPSIYHKISVRKDPTNGDSTRVKRNIHILDNPNNLLEVIRARIDISQGLTGNKITTGPNQYHLTRTFLDGEALRIFDFKSTELGHKNVSDLILVMDHVVKKNNVVLNENSVEGKLCINRGSKSLDLTI